MTTVLVTGGAGFIGSHVVDLLISEGYKVAVVDDLSTGSLKNLNQEKIDFYNVSILDKEFNALAKSIKPSYIIHLAAQANVVNSINFIVDDAAINILGTVNVIDAAKSNDVKKIVYASSAAVYGDPMELPIKISHPINPKSPYGLSKYTAELYLQMAKQKYAIDYTILRYSNVYGPRQIHTHGEGGVVNTFFKYILDNQRPYIYGDGNQTRDFIYVKDVARANLKALELASGKTLNVSSGSSISINALFDMIISITGREVSPIYCAPRNSDIKHSVLDNSLTKIELDWYPEFDLRKGLEETLKEFFL